MNDTDDMLTELGVRKDILQYMLTNMFKKEVTYDIDYTEPNKYNISIYDSNDNLLHRPKVGPNVKSNSTLGYLYTEENICLLPNRDKTFTIKKGCSRNKEIRPLFKIKKVDK